MPQDGANGNEFHRNAAMRGAAPFTKSDRLAQISRDKRGAAKKRLAGPGEARISGFNRKADFRAMAAGDIQPRRNLVVVRAGRNSLHPGWLDAGARRNWDLAVSVYDPEARFDHAPDVAIVSREGGKWDGLFAYFAQSDALSRYDYVWLPDDDLAANSASIDAMFDAMRRYDLDIAQPSLTRDSYFTHFLFLSCPGFRLRYVNFIEIMAPCLKSRLLAKVLDDFRGSMSGFGMDYVWCRLSDQPRDKAAILDEVAVRHTRPVGKALRGAMAARGLDAKAEERLIRARYGIEGKIRPVVYAAIDSAGHRRDGAAALGFAMAKGYLSAYREFGPQESASFKIVQLLRRQLVEKADLTPLKRRDPVSPPPGLAEAVDALDLRGPR